MDRRSFLVMGSAAVMVRGAAPVVSNVVSKAGGKRILTLVYDKSIGAMRAIDRLVP